MRNNTLSIHETYRSNVMQLPQVLMGRVTEHQAEAWLKQLCAIEHPNRVGSVISQQAGLGAEEMRALVAHSRNEYYPTLSANEILDRKWLKPESIKQTASNSAKSIFINIARGIVTDKYGMSRNRELESEFTRPIQGSWRIGRPALVLSGDKHLLIDIQFEDSRNNVDNVRSEDKLKLHHYDLIAAEKGITNTDLVLIKVSADQSFTDAISALSATSTSIQSALARHANELRRIDPSVLKIETHHIDKNKSIYPELLDVGSRAWEKMLSGQKYELSKEQSLSLSEPHRQAYRQASQEFCAAETVFRAAKETSEEAKKKLIDTARQLGIDSNHKPEFEGASVRSYDRFDKVGAGELLVSNHGVDRSTISEQSYDVVAMARELERLGVNPSLYRKIGEYDKEKILDTAEQLNVALDQFKSRELRAIVSRKTRGPIFDVLNNAKERVAAPVQAIQNDLSEAFAEPKKEQQANKRQTSGIGVSPR